MIFKALSELDREMDNLFPYLRKGTVVEHAGRKWTKRYSPGEPKRKRAGKPQKYGCMYFWFEPHNDEVSKNDV